MICNWTLPPDARRLAGWWRRWLSTVVAVVGSVAAAGGVPPAHEPVRVLTSFLPAYCWAVNVGGEAVSVENLTGSGVGPHDFQLTPGDLRRIERTDLLVVNGLGLEGWLPRALAAIPAARRPKVVELTAGLGARLLPPDASAPGREPPVARPVGLGNRLGPLPNPHTWLDPVLAQAGVSNLVTALAALDGRRAADYARRAASYVGRLRALDAELRAGLASCRGQAFVTLHDAFPYLVRRYGLRQVGVLELVPDVEPSPRHLTALLDILRSTHARAIFTEPQFSDRLARQLGRDAGVPVGELDTLEVGPLNPTAYEDGMRRNLQTLRQFLEARRQ